MQTTPSDLLKFLNYLFSALAVRGTSSPVLHRTKNDGAVILLHPKARVERLGEVVVHSMEVYEAARRHTVKRQRPTRPVQENSNPP